VRLQGLLNTYNREEMDANSLICLRKLSLQVIATLDGKEPPASLQRQAFSLCLRYESGAEVLQNNDLLPPIIVSEPKRQHFVRVRARTRMRTNFGIARLRSRACLAPRNSQRESTPPFIFRLRAHASLPSCAQGKLAFEVKVNVSSHKRGARFVLEVYPADEELEVNPNLFFRTQPFKTICKFRPTRRQPGPPPRMLMPAPGSHMQMRSAQPMPAAAALPVGPAAPPAVMLESLSVHVQRLEGNFAAAEGDFSRRLAAQEAGMQCAQAGMQRCVEELNIRLVHSETVIADLQESNLQLMHEVSLSRQMLAGQQPAPHLPPRRKRMIRRRLSDDAPGAINGAQQLELAPCLPAALDSEAAPAVPADFVLAPVMVPQPLDDTASAQAGCEVTPPLDAAAFTQVQHVGEAYPPLAAPPLRATSSAELLDQLLDQFEATVH
jgi:hypothetical protein